MSDTFGITPRSFRLILDAFDARPEILEARIFGSRALGSQKSGSDIDIALFGPEVGEATARKLSETLNEETPIPYHVDVVPFEECGNAELKRHISDFGIVFWRRGGRGPIKEPLAIEKGTP
jgi:predicted nucleotidyltransferase